MLHLPLLWLRQLVYGVLTLLLIVCLTEVALRVYDSATAQVTRRDLYDTGITCKSWTTHHGLRPAQKFLVKHCDDDSKIRLVLSSRGTRGTEPVIPKPVGTFRILCLGDELTLATHTSETETFCAQLQQMLQTATQYKIEVLNAGVPDFCPLLSYLQYRHELLALQADVVLLHFDMSDVNDDYGYRRLTTVGPGGEPVACPHPKLQMPKTCLRADQEHPLLLPNWAKEHAGRLVTRQVFQEPARTLGGDIGRYLWLQPHSDEFTVHARQALQPLQHLDELVRKLNGRLVLSVIPAPWQLSATACDSESLRKKYGIDAGTHFTQRKPFELIDEFCAGHAIPCCDTSGPMQGASPVDALYLKNAVQFSPQGHRVYAQAVARFLQERITGPWTPSGLGGTAPATTPPVRNPVDRFTRALPETENTTR